MDFAAVSFGVNQDFYPCRPTVSMTMGVSSTFRRKVQAFVDTRVWEARDGEGRCAPTSAEVAGTARRGRSGDDSPDGSRRYIHTGTPPSLGGIGCRGSGHQVCLHLPFMRLRASNPLGAHAHQSSEFTRTPFGNLRSHPEWVGSSSSTGAGGATPSSSSILGPSNASGARSTTSPSSRRSLGG